jgi:hypothetical protein
MTFRISLDWLAVIVAVLAVTAIKLNIVPHIPW